jgi:hypothetical protein
MKVRVVKDLYYFSTNVPRSHVSLAHLHSVSFCFLTLINKTVFLTEELMRPCITCIQTCKKHYIATWDILKEDTDTAHGSLPRGCSGPSPGPLPSLLIPSILIPSHLILLLCSSNRTYRGLHRDQSTIPSNYHTSISGGTGAPSAGNKE